MTHHVECSTDSEAREARRVLLLIPELLEVTRGNLMTLTFFSSSFTVD